MDETAAAADAVMHDAAADGAGPAEQPQQTDANGVPAAEAPAAPADPNLEKYNQLYTTVKEKPEDFNTWTSLLGASEKLDIAYTRAAYDNFLAEFPLCFGYWKKYAEAEKRHENDDIAIQVYERAVQSVPYSPDIWVAYAGFLQARGKDADTIRGVYERGLAYVSTDYNAHTLWDKYISFEQEHGTSLHLVALYPRILACPLKELDRYYKAVQLLAATKPLAELLAPEAAEQLRALALAAKQQKAAAAAAAAKAEPAAAAADVKQEGEEAAPAAAAPAGEDGGEAPPGAEGEAADGGGSVAAAADEAIVSDDDVKAAWLKQCTALYEATKEHVLGPRKPFEDKIKRPYYHVKPLDAVQLKTWVAYLEWVEGTGDVAAAIHLYERCLVACANYPEFWMRYIRWLDAHNPSTAPAALQRAALLFCKRRPEMVLFAAQYEELHGDGEAAWASFTRLLADVAPGWLQGVVAAASFQRRAGNKDMACSVYESAIAQLTKALKGADSSSAGVKQESAAAAEGEEQAAPGAAATAAADSAGATDSSKVQELVFLTLQYAHFLLQLYNDATAARHVVSSTLDLCPGSSTLWEGAIFLEEQLPGDDRVTRVCALYDRALAPQQPQQQTAVKQEDNQQEPQQEGKQGGDDKGSDSSSGSKAEAAAHMQLSSDERQALSNKYVEFVDMYGDAALLAKAQARHASEFMLPANALQQPAITAAGSAAGAAAAGGSSRKRAAVGAATGSAAKAARMDDGAAMAAAADPYAYSGYGYGYGYGYPPPQAGYGYGPYGY